MNFTEKDLQYVVGLCQYLQHRSFGTAGKWLKFHAPEARIESVDEGNDTIDTPCFSIQMVHEEEQWLGITRKHTCYVVFVPKEGDLCEIGDAACLSDAILIVYQYAVQELFRDAVQAFEYNREKEAA